MKTRKKIYAWTCIWIMLLQVIMPVHSYALTGGPSQPEFSSFEPIGTTEMVNLPSGDFQYNIPLMDVGGYPLNLAYHSGITADMEAACVGLGWTINPGVINRNIRAIPDDFNGSGDEIVNEFNMKPNVTIGGSASSSIELFGKETKLMKALKKADIKLKTSLNMGVFYNTYWGLGYEFGLSPSFSAGNKGMGYLTAGMGMSMNSQNGANFNPSLSYSKQIEQEEITTRNIGSKIGLSVNSREGLVATHLSSSISDETSDNKFSVSAGSSTSAKYSYATKSYSPNISMPQNNLSISMSVKPIGLEMFGSNTAATVSGYLSVQNLKDKVIYRNPYGTLYSQNGYKKENSLMDFSREKEEVFHDYSINLPIVRQGSDIYNLSGQGIGGSYQIHRSDVPMFFDSKSVAVSNGGSIGAEFGTGNTLHGGIDVHFNHTNSESKKWDIDNNILKNYNFHPNGNATYEPAYFKAAGEMAIESDVDYYNSLGKNLAVKAKLVENGPTKFHVSTDKNLVYSNDAIVPNSGEVQRTKRDKRNQSISYLTASEAEKLALSQDIESHLLNEFKGVTTKSSPVLIDRVNSIRKAHHISQIESIRADGLRYVYGIPAYNLSQEESTFNVSGRTVDSNTGKVEYLPSEKDDTNENSLGKDHFFSSVKTPAYAHSYLLTAVLSQDYEDIDDNGLSPNDYGSYTKINYSKTTDSDGYKWRVPFQKNTANYNAGLFSKSSDDKGSKIYGAKEIWLVHSVESKTMVAEFHYGERFDGFGVDNDDGGFPTTAIANQNKKLETITLYSKPDRVENGIHAIPIKTVHFDYDYDLCPQTPNSKVSPVNPNKGKLTLKKLYFTYGHSKKGKLSTYNFHYKGSGNKYDMKSYDRWGNYKPNDSNPNLKNPIPGDPIPNDEFPYAEQNPTDAIKSAGTWSLNKIELPSGGTIEVDYTSKHYSHVQDRQAMKMLKITGIGKVGDSKLYDLNPLDEDTPRVYKKVFFNLEGHPIEDYLAEINNDTYIYLRCYVRMNSGQINKEKWEYVSLYAKMKPNGYGTVTSDSEKHGYIEILPIEDKNQPKLNPISKYSFQFIREHMPQIAYDQSTVTVENLVRKPLQNLTIVASMASQLVSFVVGFNRTLMLRGYAKKIDVEDLSKKHEGRSYIRLGVPDGIKYGGGAMVSKIEISDGWGQMTGNTSDGFSYGQEYQYMKLDHKTGKLISSGVASYEPMIGGDENPFRKPIEVSEERKWAIDNVHYVEEPFGESFMPAPQVVFSEINVRNLHYSQPSYPGNVERTATGHSVMKYYTAKDFPVKVQPTDLEKEPRRIKPILSLVKLKMKEHTNASQGFYIGTNNMHGQAKAKEVYDENGTLISKVEYHYKTNSRGELDNNVMVIKSDGSVSDGMLGVETTLAGDSRQSVGKTISGGVNLNLDGFLAGVIPVVVPVPWPSYKSNERRYRSVSMTKVVNTKGVLDSIVAYDLGSSIATHNLAYDAETGEVLLTRTFNEFDDPIYNLKLPAHLAYQGMQGAYQNIGLTSKISYQGNVGKYKIDNLNPPYKNPFYPGDELALYTSTNIGPLLNVDKVNQLKAWVLHAVSPGNLLFLIDEKGNPITGNFTKCKVIRSGHRNMPSASIGSITSTENPIGTNNTINRMDASSGVLNAGAVEYSEDWQTYCDIESGQTCSSGQYTNPFLNNLQGNWKPKKSWLYLSERDRAPLNNVSSNTNIRENGTYVNFSPFWNNNGNNIWSQNPSDWIWTTEVTQYNPNGTELENIDKLGRFSSEIVGYSKQLVTAVAANSRKRQIVFDGFEDYHYDHNLNGVIPCPLPRHFGHDIGIQHIDKDNYHTGKYSLMATAINPISTSYSIEDNCPSDPNSNTSTSAPYILDDCNCIQAFSPDAGKYVITAWVQEGNGLGSITYDKHNLRIRTQSTNSAFKASGEIIDGWQRIEGVFDVNTSDSNIDVIFEATGATPVYFDDLRIFPFDGDMKSFVYDDISLKLLSEIDANGYANFYEYDLSGELIRIKKETERGIMTIQESRSAQPKK